VKLLKGRSEEALNPYRNTIGGNALELAVEGKLRGTLRSRASDRTNNRGWCNVLSIALDSGIRAEQVVQLTEPPVISVPSGSGEVLLHGEDGLCIVVLRVMRQDGSSQPAIVTFRHCLQSVFGYPNDEAQRGDPNLRRHGYGFFEITESPWIERLQSYNRQAFPSASWWPSRNYRHFLIRCHENLGEFLAEEMQIDPQPGDFQRAAATALAMTLA
jgi:hypothetical protein